MTSFPLVPIPTPRASAARSLRNAMFIIGACVACQLALLAGSVRADPSGVERAAYAAEVRGSGPPTAAQPAARQPTKPTRQNAGGLPLPPRHAAPDGDGAPTNAARPIRPATGITTGVASLVLVLAIFFAAAWALRRGAPKGAAKLPAEVVEVLGRAPLAGRQFAYLVRCGNKLLLVHLTPGGAETLTEITEPAEVDRLAGLCRQAHPQSATASFRQVFQQFSRDKNTVEATE